MHNAWTTSLPVDGHGPHMNWGNRQSKEASLYNNQLVFLLCRSLRNYESIRTAAMEEKLAFWIQHCWSQLWLLRSISYGFTVIVYSSRLIVLYSCHLEGRQTIENHLAHTNTGSYRHIDIPISISVNFVMGFYFAEDLSAKTTKICTHQKSPTIQ